MTSKERSKAKMKILQPDADQYITIYVVIILYSLLCNLGVIVQLIGLSILSFVTTQLIIGGTNKLDNAYMKRRNRIRALNHLFSLGRYKLLIPITIITVGSLDTILSWCSLVMSSFVFNILITNSIWNGLGKITHMLTLNKSGVYYNRPTLFKKGNLHKLVFGYNALYVMIEVDSLETLDSLVPSDKGNMDIHTDVTILNLFSESIGSITSKQNIDLDKIITEYQKTNRKSSENQLVDKEEL